MKKIIFLVTALLLLPVCGVFYGEPQLETNNAENYAEAQLDW